MLLSLPRKLDKCHSILFVALIFCILWFLVLICFVCMCVYGHPWTMTYIWYRGNWQISVLSFHVGSKDWTHVVRVGKKCLYPLSRIIIIGHYNILTSWESSWEDIDHPRASQFSELAKIQGGKGPMQSHSASVWPVLSHTHPTVP